MDCAKVLQSPDAVARSVVRYDPLVACGMMGVFDSVNSHAIDCAQPGRGLHELLNDAIDYYDDSHARVRVKFSTVSLGNLCAQYAPRANCAGSNSMETFARETMLLDDRGELVAFRAIIVTGVGTDCPSCDLPRSLNERMMSTFVTHAGSTYVLLVNPTLNNAVAIDCDSGCVSGGTLIRSTLVPIGSCGLWAWRHTFS